MVQKRTRKTTPGETPTPKKRTRKSPAKDTWTLPTPANCKYMPDVTPTLARKFCILGCTNERLAELLDITILTLYTWQKNFPAFAQAIKDGRDIANATVAEQLFHRACGYDYEEKVYKRQPVYAFEIDPNTGAEKEILTGYEMVLQRVTTKHQPADITAANTFLNNRTRLKPVEERWSNRQEITGADGQPLIPVEQSDEAAQKARVALAALVGATL